MNRSRQTSDRPNRKGQIADLVRKQSLTTREIAQHIGIKERTASVYVAHAQNLGLIKKVAFEQVEWSRRPVIVWGPT